MKVKRKPKPRRVPYGRFYWAIGTCIPSHGRPPYEIYKIMEKGDSVDNEHYKSGNYFPRRTMAEEERDRRIRIMKNSKNPEGIRKSGTSSLKQRKDNKR